jgi:hypothetical protein
MSERAIKEGRMATNKQEETDKAKIFIEQYKIYVEMADRISARRVDTNKLYISLVSALLALVPFLLNQNMAPMFQKFALLLLAVVGISLCSVWIININSYRQLNSLKFKVIQEMEKELPFPSYTREWELEKAQKQRYRRLGRVELYIPVFLMVPYIILLGYSLALIFAI